MTTSAQATKAMEHPIFQDRPAEDAPLWRYMSFAKLAALLQSRRLRFTRVDRFDDHFEGVWPKRDLEAWNRISPLPAALTEQMRQSRVAASCWINSPHESAGMWRLYAPGNEGVAIKTTFGKLLAATKSMELAAQGVLAGAAKVRYLDHAVESLIDGLSPDDPLPNTILPFMLKHVGYAHEKEVRALVVAPMMPNSDYEIEPDGCGTAELDLADFIDCVVTNPLSEPWFEATVIEFTKQHSIQDVRRSGLHRREFWQANENNASPT